MLSIYSGDRTLNEAVTKLVSILVKQSYTFILTPVMPRLQAKVSHILEQVL